MPTIANVIDFYWGPFLNGFCVNLTLPFLFLAIAALVSGYVGRGLGIDRLFRHSDWRVQFQIGLGIGFFVWQLFLAGFLFEPIATNFSRDRTPFGQRIIFLHHDRLPFIEPKLKEALDGECEYWLEPAQWKAVTYYGAGVSICLLFSALVIAILIAFVAIVIRVIFPLIFSSLRWQRRRQDFRESIREIGRDFGDLMHGPRREHTAPLWPLLVSIAIGGAISSCLTCFYFTPAIIGHIGGAGEKLVELGGWGDASARRAALEHLAKHRADASAVFQKEFDAERVRLKPYFPVFGAFFVNYLVYALFFWGSFIVPRVRHLFRPASGILFLGQSILAINVFFSYFVGGPTVPTFGLFLLSLFTGLYVFRYRFMHLDYAAPVSLRKFRIFLRRITGDQSYFRVSEQREAKRQADVSKETLKLESKQPGKKELLTTKDLHVWNQGSKKHPVAIVCASGGGSRACLWTLRMLVELENAFNDYKFTSGTVNFPARTRLITGASGGMVGAALYTVTLEKPLTATSAPVHAAKAAAQKRKSTWDLPKVNWEQRRKQLGFSQRNWPDWALKSAADFLTPVAQTLVSRDMLLAMIPTPLVWPFRDRGSRMEKAWGESLAGSLDQSFESLREGEKQGWRPSLVFSPMIVEDGRQLVISNLDLDGVVQHRSAQGLRRNRLLSRGGIELFRLFEYAKDFSIATAARMSATFPYVLPAVELPTQPPLRIVDAGYFDGYGVSLATAWLLENQDWIEEHASGVVVIQIRDGASQNERRFHTGPRTKFLDLIRCFSWLTSPIYGLFSGREAASFRNDNLLAWVDRSYNHQTSPATDAEGAPFFTTISLELESNDIALSFSLSDSELKSIEKAAGHRNVKKAIAELLQWWDKREQAN